MGAPPASRRVLLLRALPPALAAVGLVLAAAALLPWPVGGGGDREAVRARDALVQGNRLVRRGELEAAVEAYRAGWSAGGDAAALAYNLGTAYHRLGRLPEALLWYRRAAHRAPADRWIAENLDLARTELAATRLGPTSLTARLAARPGWLLVPAVLLAWLAVALYLARRRPPTPLADHGWAVAAALALLLWAAALSLAAWGPRPAVLVDACVADGVRLEPGSEVWVTRAEQGWAVSGQPAGLVCPAAAVGLVDGG